MSSVYWLARSGIAVAGRTPRRLRHGLASTVTSATYLGWRAKRVVTQENMATVLGLPAADPRVKRAALRSWYNYGRTAASLICLPFEDLAAVEAGSLDLSEGTPWRENLRRAQSPGHGLIVTTGHFGSWDLAGAIAAQYAPLSAIADTFGDARLNSLLQGHRRDKRVSIIPVSNAARPALAELAAGRALAIVADRPVEPERGVAVTFFGRTAYVPAGSAAMAVKSGAAILPGYVWYAPGNRHYIRTFAPMFPRPVSTATERRAEIERLTQYMMSCQEAVIRQSPTQWFMFRRFWPDAVAPVRTPALASV
ncbi:lysophospholipid acyltransferase family protein [Hamadaea tsunoensis]|uniref:lysophospholipid acyltransferase family protein n=1 Tax=Hamadaea tsunoensis TaxID=53368 RepID=UPI00041600AD|nr:lysophospholipid acyltransferase family protein [Hamadaea tsunoensis]